MYKVKSSRPVGSVIPARIASFCRNCRQDIVVGQMIRKESTKLWVHESCTAAVSVPPVALAPVARPSVNGTAGQKGFEEMELVRGIVRDELAGATLQVDQAEVKAMVAGDIGPVVDRISAIAVQAKSDVEAVIAERVNAIVTETRDAMVKAGVIKQVIEVRLPTGQLNKVEGKTQPQFSRIVRLAAARKNILLVGPAGCGKTHLAGQVAQALGLGFAHISCSAGMSEGQLTGRLLPVGDGGKFEYVRSEFVRCYEEGGVFLFDEIDAADSNTLLVLNSALANGYMALANRPENPVAKKHPDFVCIAAANTHGTGADRQYVGRSQLDESTLDRFRIGQSEMDYDAEVEAALCPDEDLRGRLQGYRRSVAANRLRRIVSTRFLRDAYEMKAAGDTDQDIDAALFSGWGSDEIRKVAPK